MNAALSAAIARHAEGAEARRQLRRLRHDDFDTPERLEAARLLAAQGAHRAAALWLASALRRAADSDSGAIAYRLGNALRQTGHDRAAVPVLEAACAAEPGWAEPALSLAWLHRRAGRADASAAAIARWLGAGDVTEQALRTGAGFLLDIGRVAEAESALARIPNPAPALQAERGSLLLKLGRFAEGEALLHEALRRDPSQGGAWLRLAQVRRWQSAGDSPLGPLEAALAQPGLDDSMQAAIGFALVKVDDDLGRYEQAWSEAGRANTLRSRSAHFDRTAWGQYENIVYQVFNKDYLENTSNKVPGLPAPVFVVGMPRSGTTLVERRLGRHPSLHAAGELEVVETLGLELTGDRPYPRGLHGLTAEAFAGAARQWPLRVPGGVPDGCETIDKNPINFINLGLISKLLPDARIVHCRRDPLDTALSLWFQNFAHPRNDYAYRMEDLAWMFGFYRRLMAWWEKVLPLSILTIDYERVVTDPERELRALVAGLGLDWDDAVLGTPAHGEGAISTASLWQARQPLYRHAAGRWRNYEPWIGPLREALHREGIDA